MRMRCSTFSVIVNVTSTTGFGWLPVTEQSEREAIIHACAWKLKVTLIRLPAPSAYLFRKKNMARYFLKTPRRWSCYQKLLHMWLHFKDNLIFRRHQKPEGTSRWIQCQWKASCMPTTMADWLYKPKVLPAQDGLLAVSTWWLWCEHVTSTQWEWQVRLANPHCWEMYHVESTVRDSELWSGVSKKQKRYNAVSTQSAKEECD
jgi:hypothetical protein